MNKSDNFREFVRNVSKYDVPDDAELKLYKSENQIYIIVGDKVHIQMPDTFVAWAKLIQWGIGDAPQVQLRPEQFAPQIFPYCY